MAKDKSSDFFKTTLAPESLAFRLLGTAHAVARVEEGRSLPSALASVFSHPKMDAATRGAIQDIAYLTERKLGLCEFLIEQLTRQPPSPPLLKTLLASSLALLVGENDEAGLKYEPYTTVDQAVEAASSEGTLVRTKGLVNAVLRRFLREKEILLEKSNLSLTAKWNYPSWWIKETRRIYPKNWESILHVGNTAPPLTLRVNKRKTTVEGYLADLEAAGHPASAIGPYAIRLDNPLPVYRIPGFSEGLVSVQDAAAQLAAPLLELQDGMRVLDACAAPGGKSGHMLEMADIDLHALDSEPERLKKIDENLTRLQLHATIMAGDASKKNWWDGNAFDCILADVPCTASGIIRRHPDIRWLRRPEDAKELAAISARILDNLWELLKPGGKLLLATCSVWPLESEWQADAFAKRNNAARLDAPGQLFPTSDKLKDHDGLFYALFKKQ